jgi:hypothetical protein
VKQHRTPAAAVEVGGLKLKPSAVADMLDLPDCKLAQRMADDIKNTMWYQYALDGDKVVVTDKVKAEIKREHEIYGTEKARAVLDQVISMCNDLKDLEVTLGRLLHQEEVGKFITVTEESDEDPYARRDHSAKRKVTTRITPNYKFIAQF